MKFTICLACASLLLLGACHSQKKTVQESQNADNAEPAMIWGRTEPANAMMQQPVIVYKTKADYNNLVPVTLDETHTRIVSYPHPADLKHSLSGYTTPTELNNGYLLDNRGVGKNTAFLNYTYEEYAALPDAPSMEEMMARIVDKNPFIELWNCGSAGEYKERVTELNRLIDKGFPNCKLIIANKLKK